MIKTSWSLLSSHGLVFVHIIRHPDSTNREIAEGVGLTERTIHHLLRDLESEGYLTKARKGRRTCYTVNSEVALRHPMICDIQIDSILKLFSRNERQTKGA